MDSMEGNYYCDSVPLLSEEDCLIQILLWLPVISLLRFKSVCKSWRAIIQNPFFIHTHAATTTTTNKKQVVFLLYSYRFHRGDIFSVSGPEFEVYEDFGIPEFKVLEDSSTYYKKDMKESPYDNITCCNGIICLHRGCYDELTCWNDGCYDEMICLHHKDNPKCCIISLWNPAIKQQHRFLPIPFALEEKNHDGENLNYMIDRGLDLSAHKVKHFVGFGFDVKTKDYKVLLITYDIYEERYYFYARGVQVYSLSTDSWKCIDASHAQPNLTRSREDGWRGQGHYLNGSYLFMGGYLDEGATNSIEEGREECFNIVILSFDFTKETFRTIQLPFDLKSKTDEPRKTADIVLFGEKIAVTNVCYQEMYCSPACLDIWVLNENDESESWSKFYTFVSDSLPNFITDNGEFILLFDAWKSVRKLQLLNVVTEEIKDLRYEGPSDGNVLLIRQVGVYKPSLLSIAGNDASNR